MAVNPLLRTLGARVKGASLSCRSITRVLREFRRHRQHMSVGEGHVPLAAVMVGDLVNLRLPASIIDQSAVFRPGTGLLSQHDFPGWIFHTAFAEKVRHA